MDIIMRDIIEENMGELVSLLQRIMKTDYVDKVNPHARDAWHHHK